MSLEKHSYLYAAFCLIVIQLLPYEIKFIVVFGMIWWYYKRYHKGIICFCILLVVFLLIPQTLVNATSHIVRVEEIKENYVIASSGKEKSILYGVDASLMDIIRVEGEFEPIHASNNLGLFDFHAYCKRKGISASMQVHNYEVLSKSNSMKAKLYRDVQSLDNQTIKSMLEEILYRNDQNETTSHLIYASGTHLLMIASMLSSLFKVSKSKLTFVLALLYLASFPFRFFVIRILFTSFIDICFSNMHKRDRLGLSIIAMLLYDANCIYEIGFVIPIIFRILGLFNVSNASKRLVMILTLIALQLYFFGEVNLIEVICFGIIRWLGAILLFLCIPAIYLSIMQPLLYGIAIIQNQIIDTIAQGFTIYGKLPLLMIIVWFYYLLRWISHDQSKDFYKLIILLVLQMNLLHVNPIGEVSFIDVGQGDCILIKEPFGKSVTLIDVAGVIGSDLAKNTIAPFLKARGITHLDQVIITHDDYDHNGSLNSLKQMISIDEIIVEKRDVALENTILYSLNQTTNTEDANDQSIVLYGMINGLSYMFMGDASTRVEADIIEKWNQLSCDVLKVGHHGSNTSSSPDFIAQMHPRISVISSGYQNRYHHPHKEVIETLEKSHSYIVNTQTHGSISILQIGPWNLLVQADGRIGLI